MLKITANVRKFLCKGVLYTFSFWRKKMFYLVSLILADPCCCIPVTCEKIDHNTLVHVKRLCCNKRYNLGYYTKKCTKHNKTSQHTYWVGRLWSSPERFPYFVPSTWYRLSLPVDPSSLPDWSPNWHMLYHGTHPPNIHKIIENGFLV